MCAKPSVRSPQFTVPGYWLHKPSGQARSRIAGRDVYLGVYDSPESRRRYGELVAQAVAGLIAVSAATSHPSDSVPELSTNELLVAFLTWARDHYRKPDGRQTDEWHCLTSALGPLAALYGHTPANQLGPLALKAVRQAMVAKGWCRTYVNKSVGRIRRVFRWGVENELVEPAVLQKLEAVAPLLAGRTEAPDHPRRHALSQAQLDAVRALVTPLVRDLIDLQLLTGARSGELLGLTTGAINRSDAVWFADLQDHKSAHRGRTRRLYFGPQAQAILQRHFPPDPAQHIFSITRNAYGKAVAAASLKAGGPRWSPHWLRHTAAARLRDELGLETAQAILGHARADMTEHYAGLTHERARKAAERQG